MNPIAIWGVTFAALLFIAALAGTRVRYIGYDRGDTGKEQPKEKRGSLLGILVDDRQRFSLTHFQIILWLLVVLSLVAAVFVVRLRALAVTGGDIGQAASFPIPSNVLGLLAISGGSAVLSTAVKSLRTEGIRLRNKSEKPPASSFGQVFMTEEGPMTDKVVDVTKFQNFVLTIIAVGAYVALVLGYLSRVTVVIEAGEKLALGPAFAEFGVPDLSERILWLVAVSHAAYLGGKLPPKN